LILSKRLFLKVIPTTFGNPVILIQLNKNSVQTNPKFRVCECHY
jgi:hypothetical protein